MSLKRADSLMSIYDFASIVPYLDIRGVFGVSTTNCIADSYTSTGCDYLWVEYPFQKVQSPSRVMLTNRIKQAEKLISDFLGYHVGPTVERENQIITNWYQPIKTDKKKVIAAGKEIFTKVGDAVPFSRTFYDSGGWGFNDTVRYTFGDVGTPFTLSNDEICNLFVFPSTYDLQKEYRLRPFTVIVDTNQVHIDVSIYLAVTIEEYNKLPTTQANGQIKAIDVCNIDNIISQVNLYVRSFDLPAGKVFLSPNTICTCNNLGNCSACNLETLDICLQPKNGEGGLLKVVPIINTELDPLLPPCWEPTDIVKCCHIFNLNHPYDCFCNQPLSINFEYLSGCGNSWGDTCIIDGVCDKFKLPIALSAMGLMPKICDCGCMDEAFSYHQRDLRISAKEGTRVNYLDIDLFYLGSTQGAVDAYNMIKNDIHKRIDYAMLV